MPIRGEVPETVKRRGGPVRYDPLRWRPLPGRDLRDQLKPRRAEVKVTGEWDPSQPIHAAGYPVEYARRGQALQRRRRNAGLLSLAASQQAPLILGDRR
jgi:hypothetical protein